MFAYAVGLVGAMNTTVGAVPMAIFGFSLIVAGVFPPDPVRGYPPGALTEVRAGVTWQHRVHHIVGAPIAFLALWGSCLTIAGHLEGFWRLYTGLTAVAGLAFTIRTALAFQKDAAYTGLVQRGLILVYWSWIVLLAINLAIVQAPSMSM